MPRPIPFSAASCRPPPLLREEGKEGTSSSVDSSIASLIERATSTTDPSVDPRLLRAIKSSARSSDAAVRLAFRSLLSRISNSHSHVRLLAFLIADELFMRSKLFRSLLAEALDTILPLVVGFRRAQPLPAPTASAAALCKAAVQAVERWHHRFGVHYRQLRLAVNYLKDSARIQFPGLPAAAEARAAREARTQEILASKVEQLRQNFATIKDEIRSTIYEIRNGLEIIRVENEKFEGYGDDDDAEQEIVSLAMRDIRMASLMAGERVHETRENTAVFDALREVYRLLVSKHLVTVQEWISVLVRVDLADNRFRDSALKEFIDVKNEIRAVRDKCSELGLDLDNGHKRKAVEEDEDDDFWVEGKIEVPSSDIAGTSKDASKGKSVVSEVNSDDDKVLNAGHISRKVDPEKARLLAQAPMLPWSSVLDNWGSVRDAHVNQRGLEIESHWGRVDNDAVIPAAKIAELSVYSSVYKEEPVEIQPCFAPLRKGGLCQRRDLKVCPFHGPIIPRDAEGNPIEPNGGTDGKSMEPSPPGTMDGNSDCGDNDGTLDLGKDMIKQLARQAAKNDLGKDTFEQLARQAIRNVRKRDIDDKALERAKRARIHQHNEDVLREAALASTSHSAAYGQCSESSARGGRQGKKKGQKGPTLASMLKKKVTSKDRISQRLLNTRVTDATLREVSQNEDFSYREAFPNQW